MLHLALMLVSLTLSLAPEEAAVAPPTEWRPVADLVAGRFRAHESDPGPVLRFDDPGVYKYLDFHKQRPWTERTYTRQQGFATMVKGTRATLRFPATAADCAGGCVLSIGLYATETMNTVLPILNGMKLGEGPVGDRWGVARFEVPPGGLVEGENGLELRFASATRFAGGRHAAGLRYVRFDPPGTTFDQPKLAPRMAKVTMSGTPVDVLRRSARTSYYVLLPEKARLRLVLVTNPSAEADFGVRVVDLESGVAHDLLPSFRVPQDLRTERTVDLAPVAGRAVRLDLLWSGPGQAGVAEAALEVPIAAPVAAPADGPIARNVVVWAIDTLRADQLRLYNPSSPVETPHLDALAKHAVLFAPALAAGAHSLPSHASLLLGKQPTAHKVYIGDDRVPESEVLLSEAVEGAGIRTGLVSCNGYVSDKWGFAQGWTYATNLLREGKGAKCEKLVEVVDRFLDEGGDARFFLYLVPVEPHVPYRFDERFTEKYDAPGPYKGQYKKSVTGHDLGAIRGGREVSPRDRTRMIALYRGAVSHSDACFGDLLKVLERRGRTGDTAVVVVSDHGDELFDRGGVGHAHSVHQEVVNVPFLVSLPGRLLEGVTRREGAGHTDLFPTILGLLGVPLPESGLQGQSLVPALVDPSPRLPGARLANHGIVKRGMQLGPYKLIADWEGGEKLYDHRTDPGEQTDLVPSKPGVVRLARDVLSMWLPNERRWLGAEWGDPAFPSAAYTTWLERGWQEYERKPRPPRKR